MLMCSVAPALGEVGGDSQSLLTLSKGLQELQLLLLQDAPSLKGLFPVVPLRVLLQVAFFPC